jgi:bifunctional non-homologous end joining protein LigD
MSAPVIAPDHPSLLPPRAHSPTQVLAAAAKAALPATRVVAPMLATRGVLPVMAADTYAYEVKWDGYRVLARWDGARLDLLSRNGRDLGARFAEVAGLRRALRRPALLDGEVVALDRAGHASFSALQTRMPAPRGVRGPGAWDAGQHRLRFMVFDLLHYAGRDLTGRPYEDRRVLLESLALEGAAWSVPPMHADGAALLAAMRATGQEGVIAKRLASVYVPGRRSPDWIKVTVELRDEFVVAGWWSGGDGLGSLLLACHRVPGDRLVYCGKVGTGFDARERRLLEGGLRKLAVRHPLIDGDLPRAAGVTWCRPLLVAEVRHRGWTHGGALRHPSFVGLRVDQGPDEVVHRREVTP